MALLVTSCGFDINLSDFGPGKKGNGKVVQESRNVDDDFTGISVSEGLQVYVTQADDYEIEVEADENIIDLIGTDIRNGTLRVHAIENIGKATKKVYISLPEIATLESSSGAHLTSQSTLEADALRIECSSGSILSVDLTANSVEVDASSGANLNLEGSAERANIDVSSGGNINASDLKTATCHADASSGGNISVTVSDDLTADASSGGNISYSGGASLHSKKNISGSITHRD